MVCERARHGLSARGACTDLAATRADLLWIFSDVLSRAFDSWILPLLGFFLLPWTTLAYAAFWDWGPGHHVTGFEWFFVALAFVINLSSYTDKRRAQSAR